MAERRMFAKTIIDSDAFLDMPLSAQALYFHLSMRADDDGFVNNPKKIQRLISATEDDLKLLVAKSFLLIFENGVVVIKHWRIHNYIRGDRKKNTVYKEEMSLLGIKENGAYTLKDGILELPNDSNATKRQIAYEKSTLPYSFSYKIRHAFTDEKCPICGCAMTHNNNLTKPTVQHIIPINKGGEHEIDNIAVICASCNSSIRDTETGVLNNKEVIDIWDRIVYAETHKIDWFDNKSLLEKIDINQMSTKCQPSVSQVSAQDRLGKDSIDKDSIDKDNLSNTNVLDCPTKSDLNNKKYAYERETMLWNELKSLGIAPIRGISPDSERAKHLKARFNQYGADSFVEIIEAIKESDFLQGKHNGRPWQVTFDWVILPSNYPKVLEGNYKNKGNNKTGSAFDNIDIGD